MEIKFIIKVFYFCFFKARILHEPSIDGELDHDVGGIWEEVGKTLGLNCPNSNSAEVVAERDGRWDS